MPFKVDWSLKSEPVGIPEVSKMTGAGREYVKQMYRSGALGPAPDVSLQVSRIPLFHVAALFVLQEAAKKNISFTGMTEELWQISGAVLVQLQLGEVAAGRCLQRGGTPSLNIQLWALLKSPEGRRMLEKKLPRPACARRYACFGERGFFTSDDYSEADLSGETVKVIDTWSVASQMKQGLLGTIFVTHIA